MLNILLALYLVFMSIAPILWGQLIASVEKRVNQFDVMQQLENDRVRTPDNQPEVEVDESLAAYAGRPGQIAPPAAVRGVRNALHPLSVRRAALAIAAAICQRSQSNQSLLKWKFANYYRSTNIQVMTFP